MPIDFKPYYDAKRFDNVAIRKTLWIDLPPAVPALPDSFDVLVRDRVDGEVKRIDPVDLFPSGGGGTYTVNNALSPQLGVPTNFQLGGQLIKDTDIPFNDDLYLNFGLGSSTSYFAVGSYSTSPYVSSQVYDIATGDKSALSLETYHYQIAYQFAAGGGYYMEAGANIGGENRMLLHARNTTATSIHNITLKPDELRLEGYDWVVNGDLEVASLLRTALNAPEDGIGGYLSFKFDQQIGGAFDLIEGSRIRTTLTNVGFSQATLEFYTRNGGTIDRKFSLNEIGGATLDKYGVNTFAGTPATALGADSFGNIVEFAVGGGGGGSTYTVNNGLSPESGVPTNFQLGGALNMSTTVDFSSNPLTILGTYAGGLNSHGYIKFLSGNLDSLYDGSSSMRFGFRQGAALLLDVFDDSSSYRTLMSIEKDRMDIETKTYYLRSPEFIGATQTSTISSNSLTSLLSSADSSTGRNNIVRADYNGVELQSNKSPFAVSTSMYAEDVLDKWNATVYNQTTFARTHIRMSNGNVGGIILEDFVVGQATNRVTVNNAGVFIDSGQTGAKFVVSSTKVKLSNLPTYEDEAEATTAGLETSMLYKTSTGEVRIKL